MDYIVCGWYTPDYRMWADRLLASVQAAGVPFDIVQVPKLVYGWEANTRRKASMLLRFMDSHPEKTVILVDADCTVDGELSGLAAVAGDICLHGRLKYRKGNAWMQWHSGTMVIKPTRAARAFAERWAEASAAGVYGENDQSTLIKAMLASPGMTLGVLDDKWIYGPGITHSCASCNVAKARSLGRMLVGMFTLSRNCAEALRGV